MSLACQKRKEQKSLAAQRAFRERKEKHVKDVNIFTPFLIVRRSHIFLVKLEDKVAALEAKNELANSENVNLRDLLARLQDTRIFRSSKPPSHFQFRRQPVVINLLLQDLVIRL